MFIKTSSRFRTITRAPRHGEAIDQIVLLIAAVLVPFWLLGHLFLAFFPAPENPTDIDSTDAIEMVANAEPDSDAELVSSVDSTTGKSNGSGKGAGAEMTEATNGNSPAEKKSANTDVRNKTSPSTVAKSDAGQDGGINASDDEGFTKQQLEARYKSLLKQLENQVTDLQKQLDKNKIDRKSHSSALRQKDSKIAMLEKQIKSLQEKSTQITNTAAAQPIVRPDSPAVTSVRKPKTLPTKPTGNPSPPTPYGFREWTSSQGSKATLAFVRWDGDELIFVDQQNNAYKLKLEKLSAEDQQYVQKLKK